MLLILTTLGGQVKMPGSARWPWTLALEATSPAPPSHDVLMDLEKALAFGVTAHLQIQQRILHGLTVHCQVYALYLEEDPIIIILSLLQTEAFRFLQMVSYISVHTDTMCYAYYTEPAMPAFRAGKVVVPSALVHRAASREKSRRVHNKLVPEG